MIIINKGKELIKKQKDELSPSYINLKNPRYMEIDGKYCSSLLVVDYSREQRDLIFKPLIDTNININMSIFYEEQDPYKVVKDLTYNIGNTAVDLEAGKNKQDIDIVEYTHDDAKYIRKQLQVNDEAFYYIYVYITIYNEDLKNNRKIKTVFIKPFLNDRLGNLKNEKVSQLINDSEIICIYGMSLGNSDNFWWGKILQWLKNSSNRYLVIFKYLGDEYSNTILSYQSLIKEDEDIDDFLTRYKMDNQEKDRVSRQIIFSYNSDLFDFQLINQKADKILV